MKTRHLAFLAALTGATALVLPDHVAFAQSAPAHKENDEHKEGDGHKHGDEGHEHSEDEHKGEKQDLGTQKIGAFEVQVTLVGEVKPGEEAIFIISPKGQGEPKSVRAWVGVETGKGSIRTKAEEEKEGEWHAHHQVSKPLPVASKLWVELETAGGKQKGSFALKKE